METFTILMLGSTQKELITISNTNTFNDLVLKIIEIYKTNDLCLIMNNCCVSYKVDYEISISELVTIYNNLIYCKIASLCNGIYKIGSIKYMINTKIKKLINEDKIDPINLNPLINENKGPIPKLYEINIPETLVIIKINNINKIVNKYAYAKAIRKYNKCPLTNIKINKNIITILLNAYAFEEINII
jgi:hypothetical protein